MPTMPYAPDFLTGYAPVTQPTKPLQASGGKVTLQPLSYAPEQTWKLQPDGNGYTFTNGNGDILTEHSPDYALGYEPSPQGGQTFTLTPIDRLFYKIMTEDGSKAFDLKENIIRPAQQSVCGNTVPLRLPATVNGSLCANRTAEARMPFREFPFPMIHPGPFSISLANRETYSG